ncbi:hypothetical protein FS837_012479 [Tulasnella sp. UAMH 9824]|nr:hypothetical protein FS837_012479 [Tulasnella sp. UAMH 9824]
MNKSVTHNKHVSSQQPCIGHVMTTVMTNAVLLQAQQDAIKQKVDPAEGIHSLLTQHLPNAMDAFSLLPVGPGGQFKNLDRYLLVWTLLSNIQCSSRPPQISNKAVKIIQQAASKVGFGHSIMTQWEEPSTNKLSTIFGQPAQQLNTILSPTSTQQEVARSGNSSVQRKNSHFSNNNYIEQKGERGNDDTEIKVESTARGVSSRVPKGPKQMSGAVLDVKGKRGEGSEISLKEVRSMMDSLTISGTKKGATMLRHRRVLE